MGGLAKEGSVDVFGAVASGAPDHHLTVFLVPFEHCARPETEPLSDFGRDGNLSLCGQS